MANAVAIRRAVFHSPRLKKNNPFVLFFARFLLPLQAKQRNMPNRLNGFWSFLSHYKYAIVIIVGTLIVVFFDENSVMRLVQLNLQIDDLEDEINNYKERNANNIRKLDELKRNPNAIEKIAREQYFMKADNEDIYVLSDDKKAPETNDKFGQTDDNE